MRRGSSGIAANSHVRAVLDVTIAYAHGSNFMQAPSFWETVANGNLSSRGPSGYRFYAHVNRWDMDQLPEGEEALAEWLEERWKDKGKRLEELKTMLDRGEEWVGDDDVDAAAAAVDRKKDE